jgi:hypothetical protein
MGPLEITLNDAAPGEGFVIVSSPDQPLPGTLRLRTTDGSEGDVQCRPAQGSAATLVISPSTVHVTGEPVDVQVLASTPSQSPNDSSIEIVHGDEVIARFDLTTIVQPRVRFSGRYQVRLASDGDPFNHQWGTDVSFFRMYAIEGANPLDPNQPTLEPPLDRIIRFHDAVALRPFCDPIGVSVTGIEADVGGSRRLFKTGDPLIGLPVRLGPQCRFEEQDGNFAFVGFQPIADFRLEIGSAFAGASEPAAPRPDRDSPHPSKAPYADGAAFLDSIDSWKPKDFCFPEATWAEHSQAVVATKLAQLQDHEPVDDREMRIRERRLQEHLNSSTGILSGLRRVQQFTGEVDRDLTFGPDPVGALAYLSTLTSIPFVADFFNFDSDCQSGTVTGTLGVAAPPPIPEAARLAPEETRSAANQPDDPPP